MRMIKGCAFHLVIHNINLH